MNISLTPQLNTMVQNKVASGLYNNASEVVREALRLMNARDAFTTLHHEVNLGFAQLNNGEGTPLNIQASKEAALANAKTGRKVKAVVKQTP
jgi:antitoxin ParD1/3/4